MLTRELVRAEGFPGGFAALYPALSALETLGVARRGYFVEGLGGAQFALPGAVERLRAQEEAPETRAGHRHRRPGAALRRRACAGRTPSVRPPARRAGAHLVTVAGRPVLSRPRRRPRRCACSGRPDDVRAGARRRWPRRSAAGRLRRLVVDTIDGEPAVASPLAERLVALGFRRGLHDFALAPGDA